MNKTIMSIIAIIVIIGRCHLVTVIPTKNNNVVISNIATISINKNIADFFIISIIVFLPTFFIIYLLPPHLQIWLKKIIKLTQLNCNYFQSYNCSAKPFCNLLNIIYPITQATREPTINNNNGTISIIVWL